MNPMDIIPPQEMLNEKPPFWQGAGKWVLLLAAALLLVWLWASWRNGWFPFGSDTLTQQEILDSLTAPGPSTVDPTEMLKSLTPPPGAKAATSTDSILKSLSPSR